MSGRLDGKVAVITGGASGMGRASVLMYLREGAKVVIADLNQQTGQETLELAQQAGFSENVRFLRADVCEEDQIMAMVDLAVTDFGRLDIMFNNAGVGGAMGMITETTIEEWDKSQDILLRSVFLGTKYGALAMRETGGGSIINTSSTAGLAGGSGPAAYSAAKAGVINLSKNGAIQLASDRIRVNAIAPGGIHTPLIAMAKTDDDMKAFMKGKQPRSEEHTSELQSHVNPVLLPVLRCLSTAACSRGVPVCSRIHMHRLHPVSAWAVQAKPIKPDRGSH